jgi:hypothetical protein
MRTHGWLAALALGLGLASSASAQTAYTGSTTQQSTNTTTTTTLSRSAVLWTTKLMNYFPTTPTVSNNRAYVPTNVIAADPNNATEYLKAFGYRQVGTPIRRK